MSLITKRSSPRLEDLISTEDDTLGSSISLSVGENSIRIKEKRRVIEDIEPEEKNEKDKWWLKKLETRLEISSAIPVGERGKQSPSPSPDVSSSMKEFLEKERMCKAMHKNEIETRDKDDTLCDILASAAFDKYPSDFENATDEDIGSILEEMSKIAGALGPNAGADRTKSRNSTKNSTEEERSVEELLEEAEKLVRKNSSSLSKSGSKSDTLVPENIQEDIESLGRVKRLEADIFQLIEKQVHMETERIRKSPKNENGLRDGLSPAEFDVICEHVNGSKTPKTLELQRRKFEEQKVEVSSSSDLDDPIERHSKSEDLKSIRKMESDKDNLQKEITDVDKDFFEDLLKKSKERAEGGMSGSSSFGQEDFSHFLKLLQGQSDKKEQESNESNVASAIFSKHADRETSTLEGQSANNDGSPDFPEKEISDILEKELPRAPDSKAEHQLVETDSNADAEELEESEDVNELRVFEDQLSPKGIGASKDKDSNSSSSSSSSSSSKVMNSNQELYTVGLTPRLELFADAIPKLLAEKSVESTTQRSKEATEDANRLIRKTTSSAEIKISASATTFHRNNVERKSIHAASASSAKEQQQQQQQQQRQQQKKEIKFSKSKSYDQICKPSHRTSAENLRASKALDTTRKPVNSIIGRSPVPKPKLQPTIKPVTKVPPKVKISPKSKKDYIKTASTPVLSSTYKGSLVKLPDSYSRIMMAGGDTKQNTIRQNWEVLCREERHKSALLKQQLESETKMYKCQMNNMRISFEEELFALKKQNIILKAKVDELSLNERRRRPEPQPKKDTKIILLEKELEKQENMIRAYESENKKLMHEEKRMQEEMKQLHKQQKSTALESGEMQELADRVKDLEEQALRLNLEVSKLREKNADCALTNEDLQQQNGLLNDELEMFKDQLRAKNNFITDRLQAMTTAELQLKKQVEDLSIKLSSKTEQLRLVKQEYDKLQYNVLPLEKELLELRVKEGNLQEKLQVARSHVEREKQLTQKLKDQVILDSKKITDLNRQVREMERILKRKNPDSVSALILTANSEQDRIGAEKVKLLEDRIASLESEIKAKDDFAQQKVVEFQKKFSDMKEKYAAQIMDLEEKLLEAAVTHRKVYNDMFTQTAAKPVENKGVETTTIKGREERSGSFEKEDRKEQKPSVKLNSKSQNCKEDAHLIATIRGLKLELANKDKAVSKLTKELQELQKTNRRLQREREKLLNDRRSIKTTVSSSDSKLPTLKSAVVDGNDQNNSNVYQNGHMSDANTQRLSASVQKLYDPVQYTENGDSHLVKRLTDENDILKEELSKMNKDFMALKNKRLHDLNLLQEEHEREMATLLKEYSVKLGDSKVVKLQGQVNTQLAVISHLEQQIEKLRDYKEQVVVLKAERCHLEAKVKTLTEKVKYLASPSTEQLQLLQDKITILQQRHESREMTLQTLVRDLLRNRTQCKDCKNEKGKNRQLCYFRQELDHILGMLQEIANVH